MLLLSFKIGLFNNHVMQDIFSLGSLLFLSIFFQLLQLAVDGSFVFGWIFYMMFTGGVCIVRSEVRSHLNISGHPVLDFLFSLFLYPSVAVQLEHATREPTKGGKETSHQNKGFSPGI